MTRSRKPLNIDLKNTKAIAEAMVPVDVMNIMLVYDDFGSVTGHGSVPLVSTLFNSIKTQKDVRYVRLKELLTAIVNGDRNIVEAMLERDPSLLLEKLDENDYITALSGQRSNNATAYRTALAVEDSQMAAMIKNKLFKWTGNDEAANTQYREQFPYEWKKTDREGRCRPAFETLYSLKKIIQQPTTANDITLSADPECKATAREGSDIAIGLTRFRLQLDALLDEVVTVGCHFNHDLLSEAWRIYSHVFNNGHGENLNRSCAILFWQQVIGAIQRYLPANDAQAFCAGLPDTESKLEDDEPQRRSLRLRVFDAQRQATDVDFYPLATSTSSLGSNYAINTNGFATMGIPWSGECPIAYEAYLWQKAVCIQTLDPYSPPAPKP